MYFLIDRRSNTRSGAIVSKQRTLVYQETKGFSRLKEFYRPIPQHLLNIEGKNRSNLFAWRGQFSPQLVECLLEAYCPREAVVLDPFVGSGTVLLEAATLGLPALGYEINPSAWSFSKVYEFANLPRTSREQVIAELHRAIKVEFPIIIFRDPTLALEEIEASIVNIGKSISSTAKILCNALVVLLDVYSGPISSDLVQNTFLSLSALVRGLIFSPAVIRAGLQDGVAEAGLGGDRVLVVRIGLGFHLGLLGEGPRRNDEREHEDADVSGGHGGLLVTPVGRVPGGVAAGWPAGYAAAPLGGDRGLRPGRPRAVAGREPRGR